MRGEEQHQRARDHEHMQREEAAERIAADDRSAEQHVDDPGADDRDPAGHRTGDREAPIGIGIPAEDLTAEEHTQDAAK